uniref:Uncharacterized protein n=1 Tax=Arundo donax TaxID=35708 RepID=A0A0A9ABF8_ARUDO
MLSLMRFLNVISIWPCGIKGKCWFCKGYRCEDKP